MNPLPAPPGFADACIDGKQAIRAWARNASPDDLRDAMDHISTHHAGWLFLDLELRARHHSAHAAQMASIVQEVSDIRARLRSSEWKTWTLWFAALGVIVTFLSGARDYFDIRADESSPPPSELATPSTKPLPYDLPPVAPPVPSMKLKPASGASLPAGGSLPKTPPLPSNTQGK
jgi:hypothetical protein